MSLTNGVVRNRECGGFDRREYTEIGTEGLCQQLKGNKEMKNTVDVICEV